MTSELLAANVLALSVQLAVLIGVSALVWWALAVRHAAASLGFWRAVLLACLGLPFIQPWLMQSARTFAVADESTLAWSTTIENSSFVPPAIVKERSPWTGAEWLLIVISAGAAAKGLYVVLGAIALGRVRRRSTVIDPLPALFDEAQRSVGVGATFYVSDSVGGPVTTSPHLGVSCQRCCCARRGLSRDALVSAACTIAGAGVCRDSRHR